MLDCYFPSLESMPPSVWGRCLLFIHLVIYLLVFFHLFVGSETCPAALVDDQSEPHGWAECSASPPVFQPLWLPLLHDNISSLFALEGISPNINLLCKLAVSQLAAIFVVFRVSLVLIVCLISAALWFLCFVLSAEYHRPCAPVFGPNHFGCGAEKSLHFDKIVFDIHNSEIVLVIKEYWQTTQARDVVCRIYASNLSWPAWLVQWWMNFPQGWINNTAAATRSVCCSGDHEPSVHVSSAAGWLC